MSGKPVEERAVAVICYRKRRRPAYHYQSVALRYYTPYIAYYRTIPSAENLEKLVQHLKSVLQRRGKRGEELIMFPIRGVDAVVNYAKSLEAEIYFFNQRLRKAGTERIPVIVFPDRYSAMRHFIFSITYATVRSISKVERIRDVVSGLNVNIAEPFYNTAILRYHELRVSGDSGWFWKVLRIGKAFKVMYLIDKA
ncbi:MAG: hypothetical protein DRN04_11425 [Thermoprotei archaeon]|nr:MAG: hypothetical protein DRN04_11425 [Thermoprotei archaeon]